MNNPCPNLYDGKCDCISKVCIALDPITPITPIGKRLLIHWTSCEKMLTVAVTVRARQDSDGHADGVSQAMLKIQASRHCNNLDEHWCCNVWDVDKGWNKSHTALLEEIWADTIAKDGISYSGHSSESYDEQRGFGHSY